MINIGDQVIRKSSIKVGTVQAIIGQKAQVLWTRNWQRFNGSYADTKSLISLSRLLPATPENIAVVKERRQPSSLTPALQNTLNLWIERCGKEEFVDSIRPLRHLLAEDRGREYTIQRRNIQHLIRLGYLLPDRVDVGTGKRKYRPNPERG